MTARTPRTTALTIPLDPVVQTIQDSTEDQVVFAQAEVPIVTGEILNALRTTGKTLCVVGDGYTLNVSGKNVKSTTSEIDTAITFTESEEGLEFELDNGRTLPCAVQLELDVSTYSHLYLYNTISNKWQYLNSYKDGVITADTAGRYLLTNQNLRFGNIDWTFFIAGGVVVDPHRHCLHRAQEALLVLVISPLFCIKQTARCTSFCAAGGFVFYL